MIKNAAYPTCCGATIIHDFSFNHDGPLDKVGKLDLKNLEKELENQIVMWRRTGRAFLLVIINDRQREYLKPMMNKLGLKMRSHALNEGHGRILYLYVLKNEREKGN